MRNLTILITLLVLIAPVVSIITYINTPAPTPTPTQLSVDNTAHSDYGFSYPLTYKFSIPTALSSGAKVYHRHTVSGAWSQLTVKTTSDFFNGIEAVRFDYTNHYAYVSVAFDANSNDIFVKTTDASDVLQLATFVEVTTYYDNRKATVAVNFDMLGGEGGVSASERAAIDMMRAKNLRMSGSFTFTDHLTTAQWAEYQDEVDYGDLEPLSLSRSHAAVPYADYDSEVGGSKADILANLAMPALNTRGTTEYLYGWSEPGGTSNSAVRAKLEEHKYLCDRDANTADYTFATWADDGYGLYGKIGATVWMDDESWGEINVTTLNALFDTVYSAGGIYFVSAHPESNTWEADGYADQHTDYISNKTDVWYTSFGYLYLYHYGQQRGRVRITAAGIATNWSEPLTLDTTVYLMLFT